MKSKIWSQKFNENRRNSYWCQDILPSLAYLDVKSDREDEVRLIKDQLFPEINCEVPSVHEDSLSDSDFNNDNQDSEECYSVNSISIDKMITSIAIKKTTNIKDMNKEKTKEKIEEENRFQKTITALNNTCHDFDLYKNIISKPNGKWTYNFTFCH